MKEFCEDVPRNEDVEGDVETCVNTPKEVRGRRWKEKLEKIFFFIGLRGWEAESSKTDL